MRISLTKSYITQTVRSGNEFLRSKDIIYVYTNENILEDNNFIKEVTIDLFDLSQKGPNAVNKQDESLPKNVKRSRKLFISHSVVDKNSIDSIVDLLEFISLKGPNLICSNIDGYRIPLVKNIYMITHRIEVNISFCCR